MCLLTSVVCALVGVFMQQEVRDKRVSTSPPSLVELIVNRSDTYV